MSSARDAGGDFVSSVAYTPELSDLMEHEKVIEQGLAAMVDLAWSYQQIRDGRKYEANGFRDFDSYCRARWSSSRRQIDRVIEAGTIAAELRPIGLTPSHESQVRPLKALPTTEDRQAAWAEAVEEAEGQPTAKQVERAVAKRLPPKKEHPATFSDPILDTVASHLKEAGETGTVLDPFAGTGRIHELRDRAGVNTVGVELEPEWAAKHPDTIEGNALELTDTFAPGSVDAIATSPTYGNRMADHHEAKDDSVRLTYKHTLGRDLHEDNSGAMQWGNEYRAFHEKAWAEAVAALKPNGTLTLNIKDHMRAGVRQYVTSWHIRTLLGLGLELENVDKVDTRGLMAGTNADKRTPAEFVITFRKVG